MKKMMFFFVFIFSLTSFISNGQSAYDSKALELINQGKWFELKSYYQVNQEYLGEFAKLCAGGLIGNYFNNPKEAIRNLEIFTDKYATQLGASNIDFACLLAENYANHKEYAKAVDIYDSLINQLGNVLPVNQIDKFKSNRLRYSVYSKKDDIFSFYKFENGTKVPIEVINGGLFFNVSSNCNDFKAIFDTGASMNIISERLANKLGVELLADSILFNETIYAKIVFVDEMKIGKMTLRNIPFVLLPNDSLDNKALHKLPFDMVIGLEVMKMLQEIHIDLNEKVMAIYHDYSPDSTAVGNMIYINNTTYLNLKVDDTDLLFFYDSGYNGELIILPEAAARLNKSIDSTKHKKETHRFLSAKGEINSELVKIDKVEIELSKDQIVTSDLYIGTLNLGSNYASGTIGKTLLELSDYIVINFQDLCIKFNQLPKK